LNKKAVVQLLITQFLSALADNAILLATIYIINQKFFGNEANAYTGIVQASFFVAYIVLAPYASVLSERVPKANVLWIGNIMKAVGVIMLFVSINPALSYAMVGVGACIYGVGKYAILREITDNEQDLYKANGWVEGSTIVAILGGTVLGEALAKQSITLAMTVIFALYLISFVMAWLLPKGSVSKELRYSEAWRTFFNDIKALGSTKEVRSILIGSGSFWMISSVVRIAMLAWIPIALHLSKDANVSMFMATTAIGIMFGAFLSPILIPLHKIKRIFIMGLLMSVALAIVGFIHSLIGICALLFAVGLLGGSYVIPMNTTLQERGKDIGSGKTIAIQNFVDNIMMVAGTLIYSGFLKIGVSIPFVLVGFAIAFFLLALYVRISLSQSKNHSS
jgi:LPLT family lysophospholipid transporter-like MFS transporter